MSDEPRFYSITPVIKYPKTGVVGRTYCMSIDVEVPEGTQWEYEEEEYPLYCSVKSDLFENIVYHKEPVLVLHRFGGTYSPVTVFLRSVRLHPREGYIDVSLSNKFDVPFYYTRLEGIQLNRLSSDFF